MDRNEQARRAFEMRAALASGKAAPIDRFAAPIRKGSLVMWHPPFDLVYQVDDVVPVLDPRVQAGVVQMTLSITIPVQAVVGQPAMGMVVVGSTDGKAHSALVTPDGASPQHEDPKPEPPATIDPPDGDGVLQ